MSSNLPELLAGNSWYNLQFRKKWNGMEFCGIVNLNRSESLVGLFGIARMNSCDSTVPLAAAAAPRLSPTAQLKVNICGSPEGHLEVLCTQHHSSCNSGHLYITSHDHIPCFQHETNSFALIRPGIKGHSLWNCWNLYGGLYRVCKKHFLP